MPVNEKDYYNLMFGMASKVTQKQSEKRLKQPKPTITQSTTGQSRSSSNADQSLDLDSKSSGSQLKEGSSMEQKQLESRMTQSLNRLSNAQDKLKYLDRMMSKIKKQEDAEGYKMISDTWRKKLDALDGRLRQKVIQGIRAEEVFDEEFRFYGTTPPGILRSGERVGDRESHCVLSCMSVMTQGFGLCGLGGRRPSERID